MDIQEIYTNVSEKINKAILLNWSGKKELTDDDLSLITNFSKEYSTELINKDFYELLEIILSVIYTSPNNELLDNLKHEIFDSISEEQPLLFQGMAEIGEKPLIFSNNILLLSIIEMFKNVIEEDENTDKLLAISIGIDFLKFYKTKVNIKNQYIQDFIGILENYKLEVIGYKWGNASLNFENIKALEKFNTLKFEEGQLSPNEEDYVSKIYNSLLNVFNATFDLRKKFITFRDSIINVQSRTKRDQDLLWWLNVAHTSKYPENKFYSYKQISNVHLSASFMASDLCDIPSLVQPFPDKVKALLLELLYKCFPEVLKEDVKLVSLKVIEDEEFNILSNIEDIRNILKILEKYCDIELEIKPSAFILQILSLFEISKLGLDE